MKLEEQNVSTFNVGRIETASAQIQASAKAFEILSSGLYSDSEFAIVREIAANAWDSHKAAGKTDVPFKVQVPNSLDPRLCFRDYGTSMSHEFMMTRVNTYFDSTKNDSNDAIGGFGLGIKSVFSYTSSFIITCFMDGKRRVYAYQIGEKGLPEISLMVETDSTEPSGVEVSIPVKECDYDKFSIAIQKTFAFYDVKPEILGVNLNLPEFDKVLEGTGWFLSKSARVFNSRVYVEMGGIAYPVDRAVHGLNEYYMDETLFIKAGIGDIDITPNREQTKMTDRTRKFIIDAMKVVKDETQDLIQKKIDAAGITNYWDAVPIINSSNTSTARSLGYDHRAVTINGKKYTDDYFRVTPQPSEVFIDPYNHALGKQLQPKTPEMVDGLKSIQFWEATAGRSRIRKDERYGHNRININRLSIDNYPIMVMEAEHTGLVGKWMRRVATFRSMNVVIAEPGQISNVIKGIKDRTEGYANIYDASQITVPKIEIPKTERKFYIYHTVYYQSVGRTEVDLAALPDTLYYFETDGRQKGEVFGKSVDFKNESTFINMAVQWLSGDDGTTTIYYLTDQLIKKISKFRPDIEMIKAVDALSEKLKGQVTEAAKHYVDRDKEDIENKFGGGWRARTALSYWATYFGLTRYGEVKAKLYASKPSESLERMAMIITGQTIFQLFEEYGLTVQAVGTTEFDELIEKAPYAKAFTESSNDPAVLEHLASLMGWTSANVSEEELEELEDNF